MNTPPLLLAGTLLFWGWQTGYLALAILLALAIELPRFAQVRWEFSNEDFNRVWNFCTLLFGAGAVYAFISNDGAGAVTGFFNATSFTARSRSLNQGAQAALLLVQWFPIIFLPMALAQAYSGRDKIDYATFSWWLRRRQKRERTPSAPPRDGVNVGYPYFAICLAATCAANTRSGLFYFGSCALIAWALWPIRSRRFGWVAWLLVVAVATALGYSGHHGLRKLQEVVENWHASLITGLMRGSFDPLEAKTAMGQIGKLKLSGRIVLRVEAVENKPVPPLLRQGSYSLYKAPSWFGSRKEPGPTFAEGDESTWELLPGQRPGAVSVFSYLERGESILSLPNGTARLENLRVIEMYTNRFGTVRAAKGPTLVSYTARYGPGAALDSPPDKEDLEIPTREAPALMRIARQLQLRRLDVPERLKAVESYFARNFSYSTYVPSNKVASAEETALGAFLERTHAGHCEYFASATVLLLRQAGVPTRYAVGYSVQEPKGKQYVVRDRHAHAWCLVWVNGAWQDLDTTPGTWLAEEEKQNVSRWEALSDFFSQLWFQFSKWRWGDTSIRQYIVWILVIALAALAYRFFREKKWTRRKPAKGPGEEFTPPGLDSEFYSVERRLAELGWERQPAETVTEWGSRVVTLCKLSLPTASFHELLRLHHRYRFDPHGLKTGERIALKNLAEQCLTAAVRPTEATGSKPA
jgi:transglutaminase-like putative cysteine protease